MILLSGPLPALLAIPLVRFFASHAAAPAVEVTV